ncbi:MAG: SRPBCC domain-containing protein [Saprospiraceae bacterium]|nr:SRPBCC domain-containing protein [Saprospiraceae bacterium]
MRSDRPTEIVKDLPNKVITIMRYFHADPEQVWRAWTESAFLDLWWAAKPYRAETKLHDFRNGGHWLYAMVGPDDSRIYARADYSDIENGKSFRAVDSFCDENGEAETGFPGMKWYNQFIQDEQGTKVIVEIHFKDEDTLNSIIEMGFQEGFTAAMSNLDLYLKTQFRN